MRGPAPAPYFPYNLGVQRNTRQREAIRAALRKAGRPLAPQELHALAARAVPGIGIATVYRALRELGHLGEVETVMLPGAAARFELARSGHHHHFHCRDCGRVFEVEGCPPGIERLTPKGFQLERHELVLYGLCGVCIGV